MNNMSTYVTESLTSACTDHKATLTTAVMNLD